MYNSYWKVKKRINRNRIIRKFHSLFHKHICPYLELTLYKLMKKGVKNKQSL